MSEDFSYTPSFWDWKIESIAKEPKIKVKIPSKWRRRNNRSLGQIKSHLEKEASKAESQILEHEEKVERLLKKLKVLQEKVDVIEIYMLRNHAKSCPCLKRVKGTTYRCAYYRKEAIIEHWERECSKCNVKHPETRVLANKLKVIPIVKT